jgi:hypothetical protein
MKSILKVTFNSSELRISVPNGKIKSAKGIILFTHREMNPVFETIHPPYRCEKPTHRYVSKNDQGHSEIVQMENI